MALKLAKFAVNTTPSEFLTWSKLTEGKQNDNIFIFDLLLIDPFYPLVYIDLGDYKNVIG